MQDTLQKTPLAVNINCEVCGETNFSERDGFYYCNECFTKHDQIRQVEVEYSDNFGNTIKHVKKQKVQKTLKNEKPLLTSWECYNYILRGLVDELLNYGAKEEIKLIALQVWAAYLRRMEVAFFNKNHDLPRLNVRYLKVDAEAIYNQKIKPKPKKQKKRTNDNICSVDNQTNSREWRKIVRKLDESLYSAASSGDGTLSLSSSAATNSVRAIRMRYNTKSRKFLKKTMPSKHLDKHESDIEDILQCHKQIRARDLPSLELSVSTLNIKHIYAILGIALNLIEDDIQLCDLMRFVQMGHIGTKNILQYFPSEWSKDNGIEILKKISFYKYSDKYPDKILREHIALLCRHIGITKLKTPNIIKLVHRYVAELCLPSAIALFAERLINLLPPRFSCRRNWFYPQYEARAMAYIIFIMKLLYGLDGYKEQILTQNAIKINRKIRCFNNEYNENESLLFIWHDWVHYIEMRKVILGHFNNDLCKQYKQKPNMEQFIQQMTIHESNASYVNDNIDDHDDYANDLPKKEFKNHMTQQRLNDIKMIFSKTLSKMTMSNDSSNNYNEQQQQQQTPLEFKPTLTPTTTYLNNILAYLKSNKQQHFFNDSILKIPNFMEIDYTQYNVMPYIKSKPFIKYFNTKGYKLHLKEIPLTETHYNIVGIFRTPVQTNVNNAAGVLRVQKADFTITPEEWSSHIKRDLPLGMANLEFKTEMEYYTKKYFQTITKTRRKVQIKEANAKKLYVENALKGVLLKANVPSTENLSDNFKENPPFNETTTSIDAFNENNMNPLPEQDLAGCRNLKNINLLENLSDDNNENEEDHNNDGSVSQISQYKDNESTTMHSSDNKKNIDFYVSKMDYWLLIGSMTHFTIPRQKQLQEKFPHSFNWLLETCAQTLNIDWKILYEQLMVIEIMFGMGIENLNHFNDCLYFKYGNPIREFNNLTNIYRDMW